MKKIEVKKAVLSDSKFLASCVLKSSRAGRSRGVFDLIFGLNDEAQLLAALESVVSSEIKSYCHYSNFLIAYADGQTIGSVCNYEPRIATLELFGKALSLLGYEEKFQEYASMVSLCSFQIDKRTWMLDFLIENEGESDLVVARELLKKSLLTASLKGYRIIHTVLDMSDVDSLLVYKKLGFKTIDEKRCEVFEESFGRSGITVLEYHL
jgi:hypothetical protein